MTINTTSVTYDYGAMVEQADPERHEPTVEYEFTDKEFKRTPGEWYDTIPTS
jgi:hypothetical protein